MSIRGLLAHSLVAALAVACTSSQVPHSGASDANADFRVIAPDSGTFDGPSACYDSLPSDAPEAAAHSTCGDGIRSSGEVCDDGNSVAGDGCTGDCSWIESGWACVVQGVPCVPLCGDSLIRGWEACDDGNTVSGDGCSGDCMKAEPGWRCRSPGRPCVPICGDRILVGTESCDDGNTIDGDGCSRTCLTEAGWDCSTGICTPVPVGHGGFDSGGVFLYCGDGFISGAEECDLGPANSDTQYGGCSTHCLAGPYCGDSVVNGPEECDLGQDNGQSTGQSGCTVGCTKPHYCGDGVLDPGEQCDLGEHNGIQLDTTGRPTADGSGAILCDADCNLLGIQ